MISGMSTVIIGVGAIGWLLLLREALQRWSTSRLGGDQSRSSSTFKIQGFSKPLGRVRLTTLIWNNHEYCLAVDMQGAYVQVIDKRQLQKDSTS